MNKQRSPNSQFEQLINLIANKKGIGTTWHAIEVCARATKILAELFPSAQSPSPFSIGSFKDGILTIRVKSSVWQHQINIHRQQILEQLASYKVKSIRITFHNPNSGLQAPPTQRKTL